VCYDKSRTFYLLRKKPMNFEEKTKNQGTSQPEAFQEKVNGDMASEGEELVELDDVQLATIVGGLRIGKLFSGFFKLFSNNGRKIRREIGGQPEEFYGIR